MTFQDARDKYLDYSHKLNDYNEISNLNDHLLTVNNVEEAKLQTFNDSISSKVLKLKQEYLLKESAIQELNLLTNILYFSMFLAAVIIFLFSFYHSNPNNLNISKLLISIAIIIILYLIVILIVILRNKNRKKQVWNQYYWNSMTRE